MQDAASLTAKNSNIPEYQSSTRKNNA